MMKLKSIDKYYYILIIIMAVIAVGLVFIFRLIFSSVALSKEVDREFLEANESKLNRDSLDNAHKLIYSKEIQELDL